MTVLTVTLPDAATDEVLDHIRRVGGTATPASPDDQAHGLLPGLPSNQLSPEEEAELDRIIARGGSVEGVNALLVFHEWDRNDERPRPGQD